MTCSEREEAACLCIAGDVVEVGLEPLFQTVFGLSHILFATTSNMIRKWQFAKKNRKISFGLTDNITNV